MIINEKFLHIPPYLSTSWGQISSLHVQDNQLMVTLLGGKIVSIPALDHEKILTIFNFHATYLENETSPKTQDPRAASLYPSEPLDLPFRLGFGNSEGFGPALQHNPLQASTPNLPEEILNKIASVAKIVAPEDPTALPQAEPHCNCIHCQVARAIQGGFETEKEAPLKEELVHEEELTFQEWDVEQTTDKVFAVAHRLDPAEKYSVFLGTPVGCTCGKNDCEHIIAVLRS